MELISKKLARILFKWHPIYTIFVFSIFGYILSANQFFGISRDYINYVAIFDQARSISLNTLFETRIEPGFTALSIILTKLFSVNLIVYSLIVFASLLLKGWAISNKLLSTKIFFVVAAFYLVRYFPIHELTQLRIGLAISLVLAGSIFLWNGNILVGTLICISSMLFHVSVAAIIPALYIYTPKRWKVTLISLTFFLTSFFLAGLATEYLSGFLTILKDYEANEQFGELKPNILAPYILIDLTMIIISIINWRRLTKLMRRVIILEIIGFSIFYGAIEFSVIAIRIRELFSVFWILYVADGLKQKGMALFIYVFILTNIIFYFYLFFLYSKIPFFLN